MKYTVLKLELHKPIQVKPGEIAADGTSALREYQSLVPEKILEPAPQDHLAGGSGISEILPGLYLFTQGNCEPEDSNFRDASEALWLESLWLGVSFRNDKILIRLLTEDGETKFQALREISRD
jgi:hypothetical protein